MRSPEELQALATIDPELDKLLQDGLRLPPPWTKDTDIHTIRALLAQVAEAQREAAPLDASALPCAEEDRRVPVRRGGATTLRARLHRSRDPRASAHAPGPGMLMLHGGGFAVGGPDAGARLARAFAGLAGTGTAVNVDFRLAPEFPFPTAVEDAFAALAWVVENAAELGIEPEQGLLVAGESSGADLALAAAFLWTQRKMTPPITGVYCSACSAVSQETVPEGYKSSFVSMDQCADAPVMSREACEFVRSIYKPDPRSPLASAAAIPDPSMMPKTYFQACGMDPLRDCTLVLEQMWRDAGVPTKLDVYPGMPHIFWALSLNVSQAKKHEADCEMGLRWLLGWEE